MNDYINAAIEGAAFITSQRMEGQPRWRTSRDSSESDFSLYRGSAGIIVMLLEMHSATGSVDAFQQAVQAGEDVADHLRRVDKLSVSVGTGWPGYAFAMNELARATGRDDFRAIAAMCLDRLHGQATQLGAGIGWIEAMPFSDITGCFGDREIYDQGAGAAGAGLVLLYSHRNGLHAEALNRATAVGERLLEVAEPDQSGLRWRMMSDMPFAFTAPNFAHGGAGVGFFMSQLYNACGDTRFLTAAKEAAKYVVSRASVAGDGKLVCHTEEAKNPVFYLGACHGPAGTARLLLDLNAITGDDIWISEARAMMRGVSHLGAPEVRSPGFWKNHGQCCGDSGIGEFALLMAERTDDPNYLALARRCADVVIANSTLDDNCRYWEQAEHRARPNFIQAQTGYMQGAAGIVSFLIHLGTTLEGRPTKISLPDWPPDRPNVAR